MFVYVYTIYIYYKALFYSLYIILFVNFGLHCNFRLLEKHFKKKSSRAYEVYIIKTCCTLK